MCFVNKTLSAFRIAKLCLIQSPRFSFHQPFASKRKKKGRMMELLQQILSLDSLAHSAAIVSIVVLVVLFLYWYGTRGFADLKKLNVPGPKPLPFLGNFLEASKYRGLHLMHCDCFKKYGKVFAMCLGGRPSLVVGDPELLKQIMVKDFPNFHNRFLFQK